MWQSVVTVAIGVAVRATSSSYGQLRPSCHCIQLRSVSAARSVEKFPGFEAGDDIRAMPANRTGRLNNQRNRRDEATGTRTASQFEQIPSIISTDGLPIILIALT